MGCFLYLAAKNNVFNIKTKYYPPLIKIKGFPYLLSKKLVYCNK